jgi:hypothetical protein
VKFNWLSDSCHSGDLDREIAPPMKRLEAGIKILGYRFFPVPADIAWGQRAAREKQLSSMKAIVQGKLDVGFVGGCQSNQKSIDGSFNNRPNGAFTYFFLRTMKGMLDRPLDQAVSSIGEALKKARFNQVPFIDGTRVNVPFLG